MNEIKEYTEKIFEGIKHIDDNGYEYWFARELMLILQYNLQQNFHGKIKMSMNNCNNSNYNISDYFIGVNKMVQKPKGKYKIINFIGD